MNGVKEKQKIDIKKYIPIAIIAVFVIVIIFSLITLLDKTNNKKVTDSIKNNKDIVVYVTNSDSSKCKKCGEMEKELNKNKVEYTKYDIKKAKDSDYQKMLKDLGIDKDVFGAPAVMVIKKGKVYANIINIDTKNALDVFIKDYDLKK